MWIIEGSYKKTKFQSKTHFSLSSKAYEPQLISYSWKRSMGDVPLTIILKNNLVSVDIVADEKATGGGVQGAAGGAVLGFLIAGPLGTAVGARIGSKKSGQDNTTLIITWASGDVWVAENVEIEEIAALKLAVATYKPKKSLSKPIKKAAKKKETSYKDKISIKKPKKLPEWWSEGIDYYKGRSAKDKAPLPSISIIEKLQNLDGNNVAIKLFNRSFMDEIENYNNWKWQYFNEKLETEEEINTIAKHAIKKLIVTSNEASKIKDNTADLEKVISDLDERIKNHISEFKTKNEKLSDAHFLNRGGIKKEIAYIEWDLKNRKEDLSKAKRSLNSINKKLTSIKKIKSIEKGSEEFVSIYSKAFPDEKKPSKTLKLKLFFNNDFFLRTYKKVFDKIRDERKEVEINKLKEEESEKREVQKIKKEIPPQNKIAKKEQLLELKELHNDGLISDDEFEQLRKKILGLN